MKNPKATHCSDKCIFLEIKESESLDKMSKGAETWDDGAEPWV